MSRKKHDSSEILKLYRIPNHSLKHTYHTLQAFRNFDFFFLTRICFSFCLILAYDLRSQNLSFVAPIPEQTGTTTMHFPEVSGGKYQKLPEWKLGEIGQINVFQNRMLFQWGKMNQKFMFFSAPYTKNREKISPNFSAGNFKYGFLGAS